MSGQANELVEAIKKLIAERQLQMREIKLDESTVMDELSHIYSLVRYRIDVMRELEEAQSGIPLAETRREIEIAVKILSIAAQLLLKRGQSRAVEEYEEVLREVIGGRDSSAGEED